MSATGGVKAAKALAVGTYTVSGKDHDPLGDTGTWTFTLTVTTGAILQATPKSGSVAANAESGFSATLKTTGGTGAVTFTPTAPPTGVSVSSAGVITVHTLAVKQYTLTGQDHDGLGDTGAWTFTLTVTAGAILQGTPKAASVAASASGAFTDQLTTSGGSGTVTFTTPTGTTADLTVSATGGVKAAKALAVGTYTVSGKDHDPLGDTGTWTFTLTVTTGAILQATPKSGSVAANAESGFSATLKTTGGTGAVTFTPTAPPQPG